MSCFDVWTSPAPLQLSAPEHGSASEQYHCEVEQEPLQVKQEQEEDQWTSTTCEKQEEADTQHSLFSIIYVQRSEEDPKEFAHQNREDENKGDSWPNRSSDQVKTEPSRVSCGSAWKTSDCLMSKASDDEQRDVGGRQSGTDRKKPQQAGETADKPYTCSVCNKNFKVKSILTRHMKTHTGEKPYSCSICGKSFIQRSYLQTHMNSHSGQKPYTCRFCGRGFTQVGNMKAHTRIHTGEKPHSCSDCGKSFREKAVLVKHTVIHSGEKPYICSVCNVKFSAQSNLTRHMKTHSGERPYCCTACGKRFIRHSHLIIHMKTHVGQNFKTWSFECVVFTLWCYIHVSHMAPCP